MKIIKKIPLSIDRWKQMEKDLYDRAKKIVLSSPHKDNIGHDIDKNINQTIKGIVGELIFNKIVNGQLVNINNPYTPYDIILGDKKIDVKTIFLGKDKFELFEKLRYIPYGFQNKQLSKDNIGDIIYGLVILAPWSGFCYVMYNDYFTTETIKSKYKRVKSDYGKGAIDNFEINLNDYRKDDYLLQNYF